MTTVIDFQNVSKMYLLGSGRIGLREKVSGLFRPKQPSKSREFWALGGVDFQVKRGQVLGIIGPNGSGKTTTLKLLSNITKPTGGTIDIKGRLSALIELGAGFHPDLTGRENVYLNGSILGLKRREIDAKFDDIVAFAGLAPFMDTPVKRYSSGMYARLGFAIAAHVEPDVLLVDEVLSVGDTAFQAKCYQRMDELRDNGTTLVFVSHNLDAIQRVCSDVLVLYAGKVAYRGPAADAVAVYSDVVREAASAETGHTGEGGLSQRKMTGGAKIGRIELVDADNKPVRVAQPGQTLKLRAEIAFKDAAPSPIFAFSVRNKDGLVVYDTTTHWREMQTPDFAKGEQMTVEYTFQANLLNGSYRIATDLAHNDLSCYYDYVTDALGFVIDGGEGAKGISDLAAKIEFKSHSEALHLNGSS